MHWVNLRVHRKDPHLSTPETWMESESFASERFSAVTRSCQSEVFEQTTASTGQTTLVTDTTAALGKSDWSTMLQLYHHITGGNAHERHRPNHICLLLFFPVIISAHWENVSFIRRSWSSDDSYCFRPGRSRWSITNVFRFSGYPIPIILHYVLSWVRGRSTSFNTITCNRARDDS